MGFPQFDGRQQVFEVDQGAVLELKRELLSSPGVRSRPDRDSISLASVVPVVADLALDGWQGKLLEAGFDPAAPSAWILEGLTM